MTLTLTHTHTRKENYIRMLQFNRNPNRICDYCDYIAVFTILVLYQSSVCVDITHVKHYALWIQFRYFVCMLYRIWWPWWSSSNWNHYIDDINIFMLVNQYNFEPFEYAYSCGHGKEIQFYRHSNHFAKNSSTHTIRFWVQFSRVVCRLYSRFNIFIYLFNFIPHTNK